MTIDVRTMYIAMAATCLIVAASLSVANVGRIRRDGTLLWALGWAFQGGFWAFIGLRGTIWDFVSIVVANTCWTASYSLLYSAIRQFRGRACGTAMLISPTLLTFIVFSLFSAFGANILYRVVYISLLTIFQAGATGWMLFHEAPVHERRSYWLTGSAFFIALLIVLIRLAQTFALPSDQASLEAAAPLRDVGVIASFVVAILSSMGFMLMIKGRAEDALRESETTLRAILDNSRDAIVVSKKGIRTFANPAYVSLFGYESADELVGKSIIDVAAPESRDFMAEVLQKHAAGGTFPSFYEETVLKKNGSKFLVEASVSPFVVKGEQFVLAILRDITDRKRAEEALRASHERYRRLFDEAIEGIGLADYETGIIKDCNQAFLRLTGYEREELIGQPESIFHPRNSGDPPVSRTFELHRSTKRGLALADVIVTKSGAIKEVEIKTDVIEIDGSKVMEGFFRDVTEEHRRRREREATLALLKLLTGENDTPDVVRGALNILQEWTGCEAAGVRLQSGDDFPYVETRGFPAEFVEEESSICARGPGGRVLKDRDGSTRLECACGAVLSGQYEPSLPCFTPRGSFWTDSSLANAGAECYPFMKRNRCRTEGYESVALIPLRHGGRFLGLLQFNDRNRDRFSPETISFLENAGEQIAIALAQRQAQTALAVSEKRFRDISEAAGEFLLETDHEGRFTFMSDRVHEVLEYDPSDLVGRKFTDIVLSSEKERAHLFFRGALQNRTGFRDHEARVLTKSGRTVWLNTTAVPILDGSGALLGYRGAAMDITQRKRAEEQLLHDALHDDLTGLPNRALFMDRLGHALRRFNRVEDGSCAIIFLDLDRFKIVNDSLGHLAGDRLLKETARRLERCIRPGDTAARLGGDEFVMLFEDVKEVEKAKSIADRIQEVLSAPFASEGTEIRCSASIGIALTSKDHKLPEDVLRDADITMYRAKELGKARYEVFDPSMRLRAAAVLQLENDLRRALEMDELRIQYQPIVALAEEKTVGIETLLRWQHPRRGVIGPGEFVPLAEETGLIVPIGEWVLTKACTQMKRWRERGLAPLRVAVNISAVQLRQSDFLGLIERILRETAMEPELLDLEITESVLMDRSDSIVETLLKLRALGMRICLDDFGMGYSSLGYLQGLPISVLKIDRSFTMNLDSGKENRKIIEAILVLGRSLGAKVIAEGIETREQLEYLKAIDCDYGQGFLFSKPVDEKSIEAILGAIGRPGGAPDRDRAGRRPIRLLRKNEAP